MGIITTSQRDEARHGGLCEVDMLCTPESYTSGDREYVYSHSQLSSRLRNKMMAYKFRIWREQKNPAS